MVLDWNRIEPWDYIVIGVASEYHKKYDMVDLEDIKQALYQWFLEHPNKLDDWEAIGQKDAKNLIYRSLRNQALDYCQRWKAKTIGYEVSDNYYYDPELVEIILPSVLRGEIGLRAKVIGSEGSGGGAPSEGGNITVIMIEVDYGYWKLNKEDRKILFLRYSEGMTYDEIAKELELGSEDAARMRSNRAIRRLVFKIGGYKPYKDEDTPAQESETEVSVEVSDYQTVSD
jgi:RNA polymerase sigma factor (sigma-70 family)